MTQFGSFDHAVPDPKPINGWYDTDVFDYPTLPDAADLIEMTQAQWDRRLEGLWAVEGGALVPYTLPPPPLTPAQAADAALVSPVTVQCVTLPGLDGEYANNTASRQAMTGVVAQINAGLGLPGGGATFNWPDAAGGERLWPEVEFVAFASAVTQFVYACAQTAGGFTDTVPSSVLVIDPAAVIAARRKRSGGA
jgi:hypothetical protein